MKRKLLIVGAGPMGLIAACMLKQAGYDCIVIDPRTGPYNKEMKKGNDPAASTYNRPTYLSKALFDLVEKLLKFKFSPEDRKHHQIKGLERGLYVYATKELKITIRKASFEGFSKKKEVVIRDTVTQKVEFVPAYLLGEATGGKRAVIKAINQIARDNPEKFKTIPFIIKRIADNPVKNHFIANVRLTNPDDIRRIAHHSLLFFESWYKNLRHPEAAQYFKTKFGWTSEKPPYFKPVVFDEKKGKVIFHFETTPNLKPEQYEDFLKALIWVKTDIREVKFEQIETKKFAKKPRFMAYEVDPHEVEQAFYAETEQETDEYKEDKFSGPGAKELDPQDIPDIVPLGDALSQSDPRLSVAIEHGIDRLQILLRHSHRAEDGALIIDYPKYQAAIADYNSMVNSDLVALYNERRTELEPKLQAEAETETKSSQLTVKTRKTNIYLYAKKHETLFITNSETQVPSPPVSHAKTKFSINDVTFEIEDGPYHKNVIEIQIDYREDRKKKTLILDVKDIENKCANLIKGDKQALLEYILKLFKNQQAWRVHAIPEHMEKAAKIISRALHAQKRITADEIDILHAHASRSHPTSILPDELREKFNGFFQAARLFKEKSKTVVSTQSHQHHELPAKLKAEIDKFIVDKVDLYQILGIPQNASQTEIRNAWKAKALEHPDRLPGNTAKFQLIVDAYKILRNPQARKYYDAQSPTAVVKPKLLKHS